MESLRGEIAQLRVKLGLHAVIKDRKQKELQAQAAWTASGQPGAGGGADAGAADQRSAVELKQEEEERKAAATLEWAAELLLESDMLRQPCGLPVLEVVPFAVRPDFCARFERCLKTLRTAAVERQLRDCEETQLAEVGAWVVVLRVFEGALLRDQGGGGARGHRKGRNGDIRSSPDEIRLHIFKSVHI